MAEIIPNVDLRRVAPYLSTSKGAEEKTSPIADFAVGMLPGFGTAQALRDWRRAENEDSAWGKAFGRAGAVAAAVPLIGKPVQAGIKTANRLRRLYHVSHERLPARLEYKPDKLLAGEGMATEGPGFYLTQHPGKSLEYITQSADKANKQYAWMHKYGLDPEEFGRFVKPYDIEGTHPETLKALKRLYPMSNKDIQGVINASKHNDSLLPLAGIEPYAATDDEFRDLLEQFREVGIPGVITRPGSDAYVVSHFPERLRLMGKGPLKAGIADDYTYSRMARTIRDWSPENQAKALRLYEDSLRNRPIRMTMAEKIRQRQEDMGTVFSEAEAAAMAKKIELENKLGYISLLKEKTKGLGLPEGDLGAMLKATSPHPPGHDAKLKAFLAE